MMASADDNNAMPPQPLVAPLEVDVTQMLAGEVPMQRETAAKMGNPQRRDTTLTCHEY